MYGDTECNQFDIRFQRPNNSTFSCQDSFFMKMKPSRSIRFNPTVTIVLILLASVFFNCAVLFSQSTSFEEILIPNSIQGNFYVSTADVDQNGTIDILSGGWDNNTASWFSNNGDDTFTENMISDSLGLFYSIEATDMDGDGDIDFVASAMIGFLSWFRNEGDESFTEIVISDSADGSWLVTPYDLNEDSEMDVICSVFGRDSLVWFRNLGGEVFEEILITDIIDGPATHQLADVNSDGEMDIVLASLQDNSVWWLQNDGFEVFTPVNISTSALEVGMVAAFDVNQDGFMDIMSSSGGDKQAILYLNNGLEVFTELIVSTNGGSGIQAADLDNDGDIDLVTTAHSFDATADRIAWHENDGLENFSEHLLADDTDGASGLELSDIDQDGDIDILVTVDKDDEIIWYKNKLINLDVYEFKSNHLLYPNPANSIFYLSKETVQFKLLNPHGQLLIAGNATSIDLTNYADGIYFLQIDKKNYKVVKAGIMP
jgi:hypothetical protein